MLYHGISFRGATLPSNPCAADTMANHTVYIDDDLNDRVESYRENRGASRSLVIREALRDYLSREATGEATD